jgi:hypothetical protein
MDNTLEDYYNDINVLDKTSFLYGKNVVNDTDYNQIKDYYLISLKNKNYQQNDKSFLGDQEGQGNKDTWKQYRKMKLSLRTQGDRTNELEYKELSGNGVVSEVEPQMTDFDFSKYVDSSKKRSMDITKRLYPDNVRQVLTESQHDPYRELIDPLIRRTIETKKPQLNEYMREFTNEYNRNNVLNLDVKQYKRIDDNFSKEHKNDIEFFTNKSNIISHKPSEKKQRHVLDLLEKNLDKRNNISIIVKNVNNKPQTYVRMEWSNQDGKNQILEFELSNTLGQLPKQELFKIIDKVLNDIIINELSDDIKKNNLGQKPNIEYNNISKKTFSDDLYLPNESNKQLKHNNTFPKFYNNLVDKSEGILNNPEMQMSVFLKKIISDIVKDDKHNFHKDSRGQNNIRESLMIKIHDYCKHHKIDPTLIELLTKDSVLNKIQKINYKINNDNVNNDRYYSNNNVMLNNKLFLNNNKQNKTINDIDFSLNKNNVLNNNDAQLINWNEEDFKNIKYNLHTVPSDYNNKSSFLYNSIKEKRSFNK